MDRDEIERRLQAVPSDCAIVFAARAALRVAPLLSLPKKESPQGEEVFILCALRGMATSWTAGQWPIKESLIYSAQENIDAARRKVSPTEAPNVAAVLAAAERAVGATLATAFVRAAANAAAYAADAATHAAIGDSLTLAVVADIAFLERRGSARQLAMEPLWAGATGGGGLAFFWTKLKERLLVRNEDWGVWTNWYEKRLRGERPREAVERARVEEITEDEWKAGPKVVNARLKEIEARFAKVPSDDLSPPVAEEDLPSASARGFAFSDDPAAPIDLEPDKPTPDSLYQEDILEELRDKATRLMESCPVGSNHLATLRGDAQRFLEAITPDFDSLRMHLVWSRGNLLRRLLDADKRIRASVDSLSTPLDEVVAGALEDLVETLNVFIAGDAVGQDLDRASLGPSLVEATSAIDEDRVLIDTVRGNRDVLTARAESVLDETAASAAGAEQEGSLHAEQAVSVAEATGRNFIVAALRLVYRGATSLRGAVGAVAAGVGGNFAFNALGQAIAQNPKVWHAAVKAHGDIQALHQIVDWIVKVFAAG